MIAKRDFIKEPLQVLSFGGGVQSTAMILMIVDGRLPKPDIIIHSDTGSEMPYTHELISQIKPLIESMNIPFHIVTSHHGKLHEYYKSKSAVPVVGIRSCTVNFKILPQRRFIRSIVGNKNGKLLAECWLGITTDEATRKSSSDLKWIGNKFPLLDLNISRKDCIEINKKYGFEVKKSGCFLCPYGGKKWFISLYRNHPELFKICEEMEEAYQIKYGNKLGLVPRITDIKNLKIHDLFSFGSEIITLDESECDSGGCFL
jgi:hypothetical protein